MSSVDQTEPALNIIWPMFISLEKSLSHAEQCEPVLTKSGQYSSALQSIITCRATRTCADQNLVNIHQSVNGIVTH